MASEIQARLGKVNPGKANPGKATSGKSNLSKKIPRNSRLDLSKLGNSRKVQATKKEQGNSGLFQERQFQAIPGKAIPGESKKINREIPGKSIPHTTIPSKAAPGYFSKLFQARQC